MTYSRIVHALCVSWKPDVTLIWAKFCTKFEQTSVLGLILPYNGKVQRRFLLTNWKCPSWSCSCFSFATWLSYSFHCFCCCVPKKTKKNLLSQLWGLAICFLFPPKYNLYSLVPYKENSVFETWPKHKRFLWRPASFSPPTPQWSTEPWGFTQAASCNYTQSKGREICAHSILQFYFSYIWTAGRSYILEDFLRPFETLERNNPTKLITVQLSVPTCKCVSKSLLHKQHFTWHPVQTK